MSRIKTLGPRIAVMDTRRVKPGPKVVEPYYQTPEHRAWRDEVIRRAGGRCQVPGCGRSERRMFADHIVEVKDGGARLDPVNGQCLCGSCHTRKTHTVRTARQART